MKFFFIRDASLAGELNHFFARFEASSGLTTDITTPHQRNTLYFRNMKYDVFLR